MLSNYWVRGECLSKLLRSDKQDIEVKCGDSNAAYLSKYLRLLADCSLEILMSNPLQSLMSNQATSAQTANHELSVANRESGTELRHAEDAGGHPDANGGMLEENGSNLN